MPESITKLLIAQSNSTSEITLGQGHLEDAIIETETLDDKIKHYQDEHYWKLLQWKDMHGLQLDNQNYL